MRTQNPSLESTQSYRRRILLSAMWAGVSLAWACSGAGFTSADPTDGTQLDGAIQSDSTTSDSDNIAIDASDAISPDTSDGKGDSSLDSGSGGNDGNWYDGSEQDSQLIDCPPGETITRCKLPGGGNPCPVNSTILLICDCDNAACAPNVTYTCKCDP